MLGANQQAQVMGPPAPQQGGGLFGAIGSLFQQNPELLGGVAGAAFEAVVGGDVGIGAQQGLMGASRVIESRRQREALELQQQQQAIQDIAAQQKEVQEQARKQENLLRKEFKGQTKRFDEVVVANKKIENSLVRGTAAGDLAGIFSFMKINDPESVVRESEFKNAEQAKAWLGKMDEQGKKVPAFIRGYINKLATGEKLLPEQRRDFLSTARGLFDAERQLYDSIRGDFARQSQRQGLDVRNVVGEREFKERPIEEILKKVPVKEIEEKRKKEKKKVTVVSLDDL